MTNKERLEELIINAKIADPETESFTEFIAEYLLANGVIVTPCKFLQKCFVIPTIENRLYEITEMKCIGFCLSHDNYNVNLITDKNKLYQPCFGAFGKSVFLTRKEAEQALHKINHNSLCETETYIGG